MVGEERKRVLLEISRLEHGCPNHRHSEATALKFAEQGCFGKRSFVRNAWEPGSVSSTCEVHAHTPPTISAATPWKGRTARAKFCFLTGSKFYDVSF